MYPVDILWILVAITLIIGIALGALLYRLISKKPDNTSKLQQELAEKEVEIAQLKASIDKHFEQTLGQFSQRKQQINLLEEQLYCDAQNLSTKSQLVEGLKPAASTAALQEANTAEVETEKETRASSPPPVEPPRDYDTSEQKPNTLAEDYGLKPEIFEPPRH